MHPAQPCCILQLLPSQHGATPALPCSPCILGPWHYGCHPLALRSVLHLRCLEHPLTPMSLCPALKGFSPFLGSVSSALPAPSRETGGSNTLCCALKCSGCRVGLYSVIGVDGKGCCLDLRSRGSKDKCAANGFLPLVTASSHGCDLHTQKSPMEPGLAAGLKPSVPASVMRTQRGVSATARAPGTGAGASCLLQTRRNCNRLP